MESEAFLLGIWKDFLDLEESLSMQELTAVLVAKHDADYQTKKFQAALKGIDLDKQNGSKDAPPADFQSFKNKVLEKHTGTNFDDIATLRGAEAEKLGFGIGMGLDYEVAD